MRSKRLLLPVLVAALGGCAPHITIADGSSGSGGEADTSGGGSGGTLGGTTSTGGSTFGGGGTNAGSSFGGTSGTGPFPEGCERALPDPSTFGCDWRAALGGPGQSPSGYCYKGGCHNATTNAGNLDLTPDDFLIARLLNVPASYKISCGAGVVCDPAQATCDKCATCEPGKLLLSSANPGEGRMFDTLEPFIPGVTMTTENIGCGDSMPTFNTTGSANYTQAHKDCLIQFFTAIAQTPGTWPCE